MVEVILFLISVWLVLTQIYWWQIKEYRGDRWWSWVRYNQGVREFFSLSLRKPVVTWRTLIMVACWLGWGLVFRDMQWLAAAFVGPILGVTVTIPVNWVVKTWLMTLAARRIAQVKPKIVGITGSYGKSTSKELIATMLSEKYRVVKTLNNENTEISIARRVLAAIKPGIEVFVMEVGAYRIGEIARVCKMAPPDVALITAIGNQHLDLFGGHENLKKAKMELVEYMKPGGISIVGKPMDEAIKQIAKIFGVKAITVELPKLEAIKTPGGIQVLDKSYSTNQQAFERDVAYLKTFPGRKHIITTGIIELGSETVTVHKKLATYLTGLDGVWVTSAWAKDYLDGRDAKDLFKYLKAGDVLLIEGRIPAKLKAMILKI